MQGLVVGLLQGDKLVLSLFSDNPFPDQPPQYLRGVYYDYKFTTREERDETGNWWKRELLGLYFNPVSIRPPQPAFE